MFLAKKSSPVVLFDWFFFSVDNNTFRTTRFRNNDVRHPYEKKMNSLHIPIDLNGLNYDLWNAVNEQVYQSTREFFKDIELLKKRIRRVCLCSINMAIGLLNVFNQELNSSLQMKNDQSISITGGNFFCSKHFICRVDIVQI